MMITYKVDFDDEKKRNAIQRALVECQVEDMAHTSIQKILYILALVGGTFLIICSLLLGAYRLDGYVIFICASTILIMAFKRKDIWRYMLMKQMKPLNKSYYKGIREYVFDQEGITVTSKQSETKYNWDAFEEYSFSGAFIYIKTINQSAVIVDQSDLTNSQRDELLALLSEHIHH